MISIPNTILGDIKYTNLLDSQAQQVRITTGTDDRAISTLARTLTGDYQAFDAYGTEGSLATWTLPDGLYSLGWDVYTSENDPDRDKFYQWNGYELVELGNRALATTPNSTGSRWTADMQSSEVMVRNGRLDLLALDEIDKLGSTEFRVSALELLELQPAINYLHPDVALGMIRYPEPNQIKLTTGTNAVAMSTLSRELTGNWQTLQTGVEGSLVQWQNLEPGSYEITWKLETWDTLTYSDVVGYFDPATQQIVEFQMPELTNDDGNYLAETKWTTSEIEVSDEGTLSLVALDVGTNLLTTELFIGSINFLGNPGNPGNSGIDYPTTPSDSMGLVTSDGVVSTGLGSLSASQLSQQFFHGLVDLSLYGSEGSAALWVTEPGVQRITFEVISEEPDPEQDQFLLWDGQQLWQLATRNLAVPDGNGGQGSGDVTLEVNTVSDEWGIVALDMGDGSGDSQIQVKALSWLPDAPLPTPLAPPTLDNPLDPPLDIIPSDLGTFQGEAGTGIGGLYEGEPIGDSDANDEFTFNLANDGTYEVTVWSNLRNLSLELVDDSGIVAQAIIPASVSPETFTFNLYGNDFDLLSGNHTLTIADQDGGSVSEYDFAIWKGGDPANASQSQPTESPLLNPLTGLPLDSVDTLDLGVLDNSQFSITDEDMGGSDNLDIYEFEVTQPGMTTLDLAASANLNVQVWQGNEKLFERVKDNANYHFDLVPGTYQLRVTPETLQTTYQLSLSNTTRPLFAQEEASDRKLIGTIDSNSYTDFEFIGSTSAYSDPLDSYQFWVPQTQDYTITLNSEVTGLSGYAILTQNGLPTGGYQVDSVAWNSDGFTGTYTLESGHYSLIVLDHQAGGQYQLDITPGTTAPNTHDPIIGEPPYPYPLYPDVDMGNEWTTALDLGNESPWEMLINNGDSYTHGWLYPSAHLGHFSIQEYIGGETLGGDYDATDKLKFTLTHDAYLNLFTDDQVITELVDLTATPSVLASVEYGNRLQHWLPAGDYGLSFSVEGERTEFSVSGYLSELDPNYAD